MDFSILGIAQDICVNGVVFDKNSIYDRLQKLTDLRKAIQPDNFVDDHSDGKVEWSQYADGYSGVGRKS